MPRRETPPGHFLVPAGRRGRARPRAMIPASGARRDNERDRERAWERAERGPSLAHSPPFRDTPTMQPRVRIADVDIASPDGTFTIGREEFPDFSRFARMGVHVQSDQVRVAHPDRRYVEAGLAALAEACSELGVPGAEIAFVDTVVPPPAYGLRYGFKGAFTTDRPTVIWVFANWTDLDELRDTVRHEAAHLAFARTHTAEESAGHLGPSDDFAR